MARAIVIEHTGGPEVLELREVEPPSPGPGELLVEVTASGVNYVDTYNRSGIYPVRFPFILGGEFAGTVVEAGSDTGFREGERVATAEGRGAYAEYAIVSAEKAVRIPEGVDDRTAAALLLQGLTAHYLCTSTFPVGPGHSVLLHAGAGGVGLLLTQLLKSRGATVFTTVGSPEKAELSRAAGADHVLRYDGFREHVREMTNGRGVDVVFDGVGKNTFDDSLGSVAVRGLLALFGAASGPVPPVDPQRLAAAGSVFLTRPTMGHYLRDAEERSWRAGELFAAVQDGSLDVRVGATYPLEDAAKAHEDLQARRTTGKLLLIP
jgi:NADPH2:quinone reductase